MAYPALATVQDLEKAGVTVEQTEAASVEHFLAVASAAVREAAGVPISSVTTTVTLPAPAGVWLPLPAPPVTAVNSVVDVDGEPFADWRLIDHQVWCGTGWVRQCGTGPTTVTVTYTHGLVVVPDDIKFLVLRIAAALLENLRSADDGGSGGLAGDTVRTLRIGDYSVTYADSERISELELPERTRDRMAARFGGGAHVMSLSRPGGR